MASKKPSGLGRGLGALLGDDVMNTGTQGAMYLPISEVESNSAQPRKFFDEAALAELADSIRQHGIIQPLTVRRLSSGYYQIIAGERRWRAARLAGLSEIPVTVIEADDRKAAELAMIENLQREDLNPMEEAAGYRSLIDQHHMTQEEAANRVGKSRSAVTNALRLLDLAPAVQNQVEAGLLSAGHARALVPLSSAQQVQAANAIIEGGLSVRQTEALAKRLAAGEKPEKKFPTDEVDYAAVAQKELSSQLGRGVKIVNGRKKGRIELEYYGMDDLNDLLEALALLKVRKARKGPKA
ncbi:ParB/RepB/Spo0J family partition protein [Dysosmobacter sp.]|uniref:ParB/RepB/Spo0J family partition protein n=1 Tax=Dysosmobacter sp. TaxID=2591382 RepID=UPI002A938404|nr:ParB/RepB/Spo0J family partition protein [Dysosmobacter sp.]MDY5612524.1 ParB/RepB/Spo0J family partition protein [Dysosmobacter sp.]